MRKRSDNKQNTVSAVQGEPAQLMFLVLRKSLWGDDTLTEAENRRIAEFRDWEAVFREMKEQTVHGLAEPLLDALPMEEALREEWRLQCVHQQMRWYQVAAAQQELIELLDAHQIPSVIIKGTSAGMHYPNPVLRCPGDVDILVKRSDYEKAAVLMEGNGYVFDHGDNEKKSHHTAFEKDGVIFELHYRLGLISNTDEDRLQAFEKGVEKHEIARIDDFRFHTFPPFENGLTLLFHINQHLRSGLGLRQILDWTMFVDRALTDEAWTAKFQPYLRQIGMETFAVIVTAMAQKYLGLPHSIHWTDAAEETVCDELMDYILNKGNFGRKSGESGHIAAFYLDAQNPIRFFKRLQAGGMSHWEAAKTHKSLRPFAWAYQIGHITRRLKKSKQTPASMSHLHEEGLTQRVLVSKLGLDLDRTIDAEE